MNTCRHSTCQVYKEHKMGSSICPSLCELGTQLHLEFIKYIGKPIIVPGMLIDLFSMNLVDIQEVHKYSWIIHQVFWSPRNL